jgi:hypothetical protein
MNKRKDEKTRKKIRLYKNKKKWSVRQIATELGMATGTVQRWLHRKDVKDKPRNPNGPPGLSDFGNAVFREMVRLTGYRRSHLFEYLAPAWAELPTQTREDINSGNGSLIEPLTKKLCKKVLAPRTFHRSMKEWNLDRYHIDKPRYPGTIAAHRVRVRWRYTDDTDVDGDILLLMDRYTGVLYAKAYTDRIKKPEFIGCLERLDRMLGSGITQINFATSINGKDENNNPKLCTTLFNFRVFESTEPGEPDTIDLGTMQNELTTYTSSIKADKPTHHQTHRLELPGKFNDKQDLNKMIETAVNLINLKDRHYYARNSKVEMTPYKLLHQSQKAFSDATERHVKSRMGLPLRSHMKSDINDIND